MISFRLTTRAPHVRPPHVRGAKRNRIDRHSSSWIVERLPCNNRYYSNYTDGLNIDDMSMTAGPGRTYVKPNPVNARRGGGIGVWIAGGGVAVRFRWASSRQRQVRGVRCCLVGGYSSLFTRLATLTTTPHRGRGRQIGRDKIGRCSPGSKRPVDWWCTGTGISMGPLSTLSGTASPTRRSP